ncbi:DNA repair protein RecO [Aerococcus urinaehominis]|uniref:DNA repair protein RecO n=1 Tax=Aerococcus urinaehominis TaxID=128944 RepID=A0A0X8FK08_9LACT|nr:DNA repair protein RecO [Aerococcus urinaehominis]AMB98524.1 DNA repair protein RecO [Aerococcus urinaehominis]SDL79510.1 DNA replication and repair protein RecO [Aerococcus urinaehominis]
MAKENYYDDFKGIVLFTRKYRDKDMMVKIFTREFGKRMFFLRHIQSQKNHFRTAAQPFVQADFIGRINREGLSFLNDYSNLVFPSQIIQDIDRHAHAAYLASLVDASMEDGDLDPALFDLFQGAVTCLNQDFEPEIITNIFELQILPKFGSTPYLAGCVYCHQDQGAFDYSMKYHGLLCPQHFHLDDRRLHWSGRTGYFVRLLSQITYQQLGKISLQTETKLALRQAIDQLYEEYVGLHLKTRSFLDQLARLKTGPAEKD